MINNEDDLKNAKKSLLISEYFIKSGFRETFKESKRIKEMYCSIEALISLAFSLLIVILLGVLFHFANKEYISLVSNLIVALIGGFISLIAFSLAALTLTLSFINNKEIFRYTKLESETKNGELEYYIDNKEYLQMYRDISFRFYHSAFFNFLAIIMLISAFVYINLPFEFSQFINVPIGFLVIYFISYSLIFNITLVSDCIKMKFSNFEY